MKHKNESFQGLVKYISLSPHGDPEGVVLADGTFVKAPPHSLVAKELFKVGTELSGEGHMIGEEPNRVFHHAQIRAGKKVIADDSVADHEREKLKEKHKADLKQREDAEDEIITLKGTVAAIATKPKGEVDRVILEDGTSIHIPKDVESMRDDWAIGSAVEVKGKARTYGQARFLKAEKIKHL